MEPGYQCPRFFPQTGLDLAPMGIELLSLWSSQAETVFACPSANSERALPPCLQFHSPNPFWSQIPNPVPNLN